MTPMPPACAMAIAILASVTVSMAEAMIGTLSSMPRVMRVRMSASAGKTSDSPGLSRTSSKVSASLRLPLGIKTIANSRRPVRACSVPSPTARKRRSAAKPYGPASESTTHFGLAEVDSTAGRWCLGGWGALSTSLSHAYRPVGVFEEIHLPSPLVPLLFASEQNRRRRISYRALQASEVRLVGSRHMRVLVGEEVSVILVLHIFGADTFLIWIRDAAIGNRRRPGHGEDAGFLYREFELQPPPPIALIDGGANRQPFLLRSLQRVLGGLIVDETVALDHVQGRRIGSAETVNRPVRPDLDPHGVDDQRVAFVVADRIPVHGGDHLGGMGLVQPHLAEVVVVRVNERDLVGLLQQ